MNIDNKLKQLEIAQYNCSNLSILEIPFLQARVSAGFSSFADNFVDRKLDLNELLIRHPAATYFIRVKGNSMEQAGISSNDILIVDRAVSVTDNKIVVARINDELTVKRIKVNGNTLYLVPDSDEYKPIEITESMDFEVWGVVISVIRQL
ncbi:MAG TPA: translesion error-prone DNA polymerase V autoproteolytic subunit [Candidatus Babeliaceae bacterium]|nr:translesion error-prone DNA polymerase V autoproteolytic subunit [Candidatus Babeliaceae bacterium]